MPPGGPLPEALFNPTHELAFLQPGQTLRINNIYIAEGLGVQDDAFAVGVRAASRPLDVDEVPRKETHAAGGKAAAQSGFGESSLTANPRHHRISVYIPAAPAGGRAAPAVLVSTCDTLIRRLRFIRAILAATQADTAKGSTHRAANASFLVTPEGPRTKGVLSVRDETSTIGHLLVRLIYEIKHDISYVGYTCAFHEKTMKLTVIHAVAESGEIISIIARAADRADEIFTQIRRKIKATL